MEKQNQLLRNEHDNTITGMSPHFNTLDVLYDSFMIEKYRTVITRWRLSCHSLRIETGRYQHPALPRNERTCTVCNILEDEHHETTPCSSVQHTHSSDYTMPISFHHTRRYNQFCTQARRKMPTQLGNIFWRSREI